jgi:RNA polymerase sigma-70 factor (ECF subfamily)
MGGAIATYPLAAAAAREEIAFDFDTWFDAWMRAEQRRVLMLCLRMLRDTDEADMAAQDSFLKAYRYFTGGQGEELLKTPAETRSENLTRWITRVAVNTCLDRLRSRTWKFWRRRPGPEAEAALLAATADARPTAMDQIRAQEISKRLAAALERLSDRQRAIFILRHYEDRKLEEIAGILGLELGTVKAHMARATARLRVELADLYDGAGAQASA